jgi:hypothetical protein
MNAKLQTLAKFVLNKYFIYLLILCAVLLSLIGYFFLIREPCNHLNNSSYDEMVLRESPVLYLPLSEIGGVCDHAQSNLHIIESGFIGFTKLPNSERGLDFNGNTNFVEVEDADILSIPTTGQLTIEAWMRPDILQFPNEEGTGYVHWLGKGELGQQEYLARIYSLSNSENRPNRISGYVFNLYGNLGVGSYCEKPVSTKKWIYYVFIINTVNTSNQFPSGYTKIYCDGILQDQDSLQDLDIIPSNGIAPFRIGTRDFNSFFKGGIGKVALYNYELTESQILVHYMAMTD